MLELAGLRNQNIGQAMLEGLTADPLRKTFAAVSAESCKGQLDDSEQWIVANVLNRVDKLTQARNDVLHRMWFVGWASEYQEDFSTVDGVKHKNTYKGTEFRHLHYTRADFDDLSEQADELFKLVNRLWATVFMNSIKRCTFTDNFVVDANKIVRLPPGC